MNKLLESFLRSDHAGEVGAVYIYKGILTIAKDPELLEFSKRHLATEQESKRFYLRQKEANLFFFGKLQAIF